MMTRPHDALFKWAFESPEDAAALLRELLPIAVREAIAWDTLDRDLGSFIDRTFASRHNDLLFSARLRTGEPGLVFLLLEHQSTADPTMPQRMLSYQSRIWDRFRKEQPRAQLPPVIAVLVSHVPGGWTAARSFEELFDADVMALPGLAALVPRFSMIALDLAAQSDDNLAARPLGAFQKLALWLLRDARDSTRLLASFDAWIPALLEVGQSRSGADDLAMLIEYMLQVVDRVNRDALRAKIHTLGSSSKEFAMTIAEEIYEEGRVDTLRSLLVFKFQSLDAASESRLQAAPPEAIDRYLRRLLTADSLAAVFED